jgi:hypothetical protein
MVRPAGPEKVIAVRRASPTVAAAGRAEDLGAHVVAVRGLETRLGEARRTVVEAHHDRGRVAQPVVAPVRLDQGVGGRVHLDRDRAWVEESQHVEVVDERLEENGVRRHPGRVEPAGIPGQRAQQPRRADLPGIEQRPRGRPVGCEPSLEPDLQRHACVACRRDGAVGGGQGEGHRFLAVHTLARLRRRNDQIGVEPRGGGDHHRVDLRVVPHLRGVGVEPVSIEFLAAADRIGDSDQPDARQTPAHAPLRSMRHPLHWNVP